MPRAIRLTPRALRDLAARHGVRPAKRLGQHFLLEPSLARRIVELAGVGPGQRVVEVGAGLGSLTVALAEVGSEVVAIEVDRRLMGPLEEVVAPFGDRVRLVAGDALTLHWEEVLAQPGPWTMVANLPYNAATPLVLRVLDGVPRIRSLLVMVQREVGERLAARPGQPQYGAISARVAYRARARVVRAVSRSVFWPAPNVDSVLVSMTRTPPPVECDERRLFTVIEESFAQRRKSMRGAMMRLGLDPAGSEEALAGCGIRPMARPQELGLEAFACLAGRIAAGTLPARWRSS